MLNCFIRTNRDNWMTKHGTFEQLHPILRMPLDAYKKLLEDYGSPSNFPNVQNKCISTNPHKVRGEKVVDIIQEKARVKAIKLSKLSQIKRLFANERRRVGVTDFTKLTYGTRYLNHPWEIYIIKLDDIGNIAKRFGGCLNEVLQTS